MSGPSFFDQVVCCANSRLKKLEKTFSLPKKFQRGRKARSVGRSVAPTLKIPFSVPQLERGRAGPATDVATVLFPAMDARHI